MEKLIERLQGKNVSEDTGDNRTVYDIQKELKAMVPVVDAMSDADMDENDYNARVAKHHGDLFYKAFYDTLRKLDDFIGALDVLNAGR